MKELITTRLALGFPASWAGKESACNAGGPGLIPGAGRSPGEGIGYPHQYSWASLVAQLVRNLPAMWRPEFDCWVRKIPWRRKRLPTPGFLGFPDGSDGKESACNVGDLGSILGCKDLGWEDSLEEGMATYSVFLPGESSQTGAWRATVLGVAHTTEWLNTAQQTGLRNMLKTLKGETKEL